MSPGTPRVARHPLETLKLKPRTTVKKFAAKLKERIAWIEARHARSADPKWLDGVQFIKSAVDELLNEFDVRDPEDYPRGASR